MLRRNFLLALTTVVLAASPAVYGQDKELIVATDTAFVPFEFKQGDKYVGFDIDLWQELAKDMGMKYRLQPMDFNGIIPGLQSNNIDVALAGITIKDERKKVIDFSDSYYDSGLAVMVRSDNKDIKSVADLNGKVVATKTGTATVDWIKANIKPKELRLFPNIDNAYLELGAGGVDAAMHDTPNVLYYVKTAGGGKVKVAGQPASGDLYGIAFPKGSPLVAKVNESLKKLKANGRYAALYKKWFGMEPPKQ